jgi:hypothetical protein
MIWSVKLEKRATYRKRFYKFYIGLSREFSVDSRESRIEISES